jgi:hypothetical protein
VEELEARQLLTLLPPPTTAAIGVIEDELNLGPSPELTFAATHADGTQKLTSDQNQPYVSLNPHWYMLQYQLGSGNSAFDYIIHNTWGQDFDSSVASFIDNPPAGAGGVTSHEDWFEHSNGSLNPSTKGNRLVSNGYYLANIDSPGWRNYELTTLVDNILASGAQGVFADSFEGPLSGFYVGQGDARFDYGGSYPGPADPNVWPDGKTWIARAPDYVQFIQSGLTAVGEAINGPGGGFPWVPNVGAMNTGWADIDYLAAKGAFAEGFSDFYGQITGGDWTLSMNRALRFTSTSKPANADRMFIMQPVLSGADPTSAQGMQERSWAFGTYLLLKGDHTYVNMYGAVTGSRLEWYPEYQVNLGAAQDPGGMPATVDGYLDPGSGLYRRFYQNGIVLVNNSGNSLAYNPGQVMQQMIVNGWGGGVRSGDINPNSNTYVGGSLSYQPVNSVTVAPFSSVILLNQAGQQPGGGSIIPPFLSPHRDLDVSVAAAGGNQALYSDSISGTLSRATNPLDIGVSMPRSGIAVPDTSEGVTPAPTNTVSGEGLAKDLDILPTVNNALPS